MASDSSTLGISQLHRFWTKQMGTGRGEASAEQSKDWAGDNTLLAGLRIGLRETYAFILNNQPTFAEFEQWIVERNGGPIDAERLKRVRTALADEGRIGQPANPDAEPALSAADLEFWDRHGYVILRDAVPAENCRAAVQAICEFLDVRLDQSDSWYRGPQGHSIWIPLLHHPALWANRDSPRIHRAFAQLWNHEDIWVNVDQAGFNPPEQPGWKFPGPHLHWDVSLAKPIPFGVQGILYLADVKADQGAFTCVPGFHKKIDSWLESLPDGADPRAQALPDAAVPIAGRAGDLVIWHHALPHGSSPNRALLPRIVQYMVGRPSQWEYNPVWR